MANVVLAYELLFFVLIWFEQLIF